MKEDSEKYLIKKVDWIGTLEPSDGSLGFLSSVLSFLSYTSIQVARELATGKMSTGVSATPDKHQRKSVVLFPFLLAKVTWSLDFRSWPTITKYSQAP